LSRVIFARNTYNQRLHASDFENPHLSILPYSISRFPCQPFNDCMEDYFFHKTTKVRNLFKKNFPCRLKNVNIHSFPQIFSTNLTPPFPIIDPLTIFIQLYDYFDLSSVPLNVALSKRIFSSKGLPTSIPEYSSACNNTLQFVRDSNCDLDTGPCICACVTHACGYRSAGV